jgi:SAM-dependent methyltransferase
MTDHYVLRGGAPGARRLRLLARVKWPTTRALLRRVGLRRGMRCLDLGCGSGGVTLRLARWIGPQGHAVGVDVDEPALELARQKAERLKLPVTFRQLRVEDLEEEGVYDLAFARFLLSHLPNPAGAVQHMLRAVRPGGVVVVEDTDFAGHFCHPPCAAFDRYVSLYREAVRRKGGDAEIGPRLLGLLTAAGLDVLGLNVVLPTYHRGPGKRLAQVTLEHVRESLLSLQLISAEELGQTLAQLAAFTADETTILSLPRIFQLWGTKPR